MLYRFDFFSHSLFAYIVSLIFQKSDCLSMSHFFSSSILRRIFLCFTLFPKRIQIICSMTFPKREITWLGKAARTAVMDALAVWAVTHLVETTLLPYWFLVCEAQEGNSFQTFEYSGLKCRGPDVKNYSHSPMILDDFGETKFWFCPSLITFSQISPQFCLNLTKLPWRSILNLLLKIR